MKKIDDDEFERHYLMLTYEVGLFMMEHLRNVYREFGGDIALCMVLGEIAHHGARPFMRELLPKSGKDARTLATDDLIASSVRSCNALSIANASGIPRETVRRKIDKLVALGWVSRDRKGGVRVNRAVGKQFKAFDRETMTQLLELSERIRLAVAKR
jgi:hypothetical protein